MASFDVEIKLVHTIRYVVECDDRQAIINGGPLWVGLEGTKYAESSEVTEMNIGEISHGDYH